MKEFQGKRMLKGIVYSRVFVAFLLIVVGLMFYRIWDIGWRSRVANSEKNVMLAQVAELSTRRQALEKNLATLKTDRGIEEAIRQKFPVVKEGEEVITIVAPTTTQASTIGAKSWWQVLWPF